MDLADERQLPKALAAATQQATAIGLRALNREWGSDFFQVPEEAERNEQVAIDTFRVGAPIIDVQTHFLAPHSAASFNTKFLFDLYQSVMPNWWSEMHDIEAWSFAEYLRNVFVESETAVAVLTSGPGVLPTRNLFNDEMHAAKILVGGAGAGGRILNHAVVHADDSGEVGRMAEWRDEFNPVGWKVYTPGRSSRSGWVGGWMLDDEEHGLPFLQRVNDLNVKLVCAHKGISQLADNGSPRDVGPAARAFPDIDFVIYHSGYEMPHDGAALEGPYREAADYEGINRLLASLDANMHRQRIDMQIVGGLFVVHGDQNSAWLGNARREASSPLSSALTRLAPMRAMSAGVMSPVTYTPSKHDASKPSSFGLREPIAFFMPSTSW